MAPVQNLGCALSCTALAAVKTPTAACGLFHRAWHKTKGFFGGSSAQLWTMLRGLLVVRPLEAQSLNSALWQRACRPAAPCVCARCYQSHACESQEGIPDAFRPVMGSLDLCRNSIAAWAQLWITSWTAHKQLNAGSSCLSVAELILGYEVRRCALAQQPASQTITALRVPDSTSVSQCQSWLCRFLEWL